MSYFCNRCGYNTPDKTRFRKHLNRKKTCPDILEPVSVNEIKQMYEICETVTPKNPQMTPKTTKMTPKTPIMTLNDPQKEMTEKNINYTCQYCDRVLSKNSHLHRHYKSCRVKIDLENQKIDQEKAEILKIRCRELEKEKRKMRRKIERLLIKDSESSGDVANHSHNTNTNSHNNLVQKNSNNTTININNFGSENLDYISKSFLNKLLKTPYTAIPKLLKEIHFNDQHPENKNIRINNKKLKYAEVIDNNEWQYKNKKEVIEDMVDKGYDLIDEHYEEEPEKELHGSEKIRYKRFQNKYDDKNKKTLEKLTQNTELIIINSCKNK